MLKILIEDDTCTDGEAYVYKVPLDTPWFKIEASVSLFYPSATCVSIIVIDKED